MQMGGWGCGQGGYGEGGLAAPMISGKKKAH